jgi:hypothetical protein
MSLLCLRTLRRGAARACVAAALLAACGVPDYNIQEKPDAGRPPLGTGGVSSGGTTAIATGGSSMATGGRAPDALNCRSDGDCTTFSATKVCDTSTNRCVECLPSVTECGDGLYCSSDKVCLVGCASDSDCGKVSNCDASECDALKCDTTTHECKGCLADADCGAGTVCEAVTGTCVAGCGNNADCPKGWTCCSQVCVNLQSNAENCASCASTCDKKGANAQCLNGTCRIDTCKDGYLDCNDKYIDGCEVDKLSNKDNCGACGTACTYPQICKNGKCDNPSCDSGYADCDNDMQSNACETNTDRDILNCGACTIKCSTINGVPTCSGGQCSMTCNSGFGDCDKRPETGCETNLSNTTSDCGACSAACTNDHGMTACVPAGSGGKCSPTCGTGFGDCDGNPSNGCETAESNDLSNCGACGKACNLANATAACTNGACTIAACTSGFADCDNNAANGCEANLQTDPAHCSSCSKACDSTNGTPSCTAGACSITCTIGFANCDDNIANGCEVNLSTNVANCNKCGNVCQDQPNGTAICDKGACGISNCKPPYGDCDQNTGNGCESDENNDPVNCGGCGIKCIIPNATPKCSLSVCGVATCNTGFADCDGDPANGCEVNLNADVNNCNACGSKCAPANAVGSCVGGVCKVTSCTPPFQDCNSDASDGCEANTNSSVASCGKCGSACDSTHGTPSCAYGVCNIVCAQGFGNCDGDVANGCEDTTTTDDKNCGQCGNACVVQNGTGTCVNSNCTVASCNTGFGNCNNNYTDGCEARLTTDSSNCGVCDNVCISTNGTASCANSTCSIACTSGYGNCDALASTGCEVDLTSSLTNCGGCGKACAPANATGACSAGTCTIAACVQGFGNCNATVTDGCEANQMTDPLHCGKCSPACNLPHATATCNGGTCAIGACDSGYANCNSDPSDGCEVNLTADATHCGSCSKVCSSANGTPTCSSSVCTIACSAGYGNCDNDASNGCEVNLKSDINNCNGCGAGFKCPTVGGIPVCTNGACGYSSCGAGLATCPSGATCGTNITNDASNCGGCGITCAYANASATCVSSGCVMGSCSAGYGNCGGGTADGCETNLKTDANNCNACGTKCTLANATSVCTNGACAIGSCNAGYADCDGLASNGCEVNINTDINNCNGCGASFKCSTAGGTASCTSGACGIVCDSSHANCDTNIANGCEVNIKTDINNCNACGTKCSTAGGTPSCTNGVCGIVCGAGLGNCDGNLANGCETSTTADVNNCGGCNVVCNSTHGTASCASGTCSITCASGYGNCINGAADGCETTFASDPAHCGNCTTACTYAHASGVCNSGTCQLGTCDANYGNCDTQSSTGCEAALTTTSNCISCGVTCTNANGTTTCGAGGCTPTCNTGYMSCDSNANNGCEQNTGTDVNHCGGCTNVCSYANATPVCSGSACSMGTCTYGFANCDSSTATGCEKSVSADTSNCGGCNVVCNSTNGTAACSNSACSITCNSLWGNCDGLLSTGCEKDLSADATNCGVCGRTCTNGFDCVNGNCVGPCDGICSNPTIIPGDYATGTSYGTGSGCFEQQNTLTYGFVCGNWTSPRLLLINNTSGYTCNNTAQYNLPAKRHGGWCWSFPAGNPSYAYFQVWDSVP